jgi:hypothetical protein
MLRRLLLMILTGAISSVPFCLPDGAFDRISYVYISVNKTSAIAIPSFC